MAARDDLNISHNRSLRSTWVRRAHTMLAQRGFNQSMSRKGNCFDNAAMESLFGTLKAEYFHLAAPDSIDVLEAGVHDYVHYYNHERIKLRLNGLSLVGYRLRNTA